MVHSGSSCLFLPAPLTTVCCELGAPPWFPRNNASVGYKIKVDSTYMLGASQEAINEELKRKEKEYENSIEIQQLTTLYEKRKVILNKGVVSASSPKVAVVKAVKELQATWIILDRQMKKDKKYFLERLSCGISRMKRNNNIVLLRGPEVKQYGNIVTTGGQDKAECEMLQGPETEAELQVISEDTPEDDDLFSLELSPMIKPLGEWQQRPSENKISNGNPEDNLSIIQSGKARHCTPYVNFDGLATEWLKTVQNIELGQNANVNEVTSTSISAIAQLQEPVQNSICSYCKKGKASAGWKNFTYTELQAATKDFSMENFLSEGGFGSVYKGKLEHGQWIAVKQHKHASLQGEKEFVSEVHVLSKARHKNVVTLLGSCSEGSQLLLVYEFICNGSLDKHLSECSSKVLSWRERIKIALGAASGLNYLHQNNIIHRDMRPSNILVTHTYEALIGDFGLAITKHNVSDYSEKNVLGCFGYLAPEYAEKGNATTKTDVYSFGVVLLELITGQNVNKTLQRRGLVAWAMPLLRERRYPELIDEKIQDSYDIHQLFCMVSVAEGCLSNDPDERPTMKQVVKALQSIMEKRTVSGLNYSLAHTSHGSTTRSTESHNEQEITMQEILTSEDSLNDQITQMSEAFFTSPPSVRTLQSTTMATNSTSLQSDTKSKRGSKFRTRRRVPYDEMLS